MHATALVRQLQYWRREYRMLVRIIRLVFVLSACIWVAALAAAQQSLPQPQPTGMIVGTVLDITGGTVPNATVVLQAAAPDVQWTVVTGDDGFFKFDGVYPGTPHRILVSASGLQNWSSNQIVLQPGKSFIVTGVVLGVARVETSVNAAMPEQVAAEQIRVEEKQRVFGVIPNFYVTYEHNAAPLTTKLKFQLAMKALMDPVTITGFGFNAAIYQMAGYPSYQQGAAGYGQRLGATFAGGYAKVMIGDAILPSLLHQDPRYFYQGTGTTKSRLLHALGSAFVTRGDDGKREINWSDIGGDVASGALENAYYPAQDRGVGLVVRGTLIGAGGRVALGLIQEFVLPMWTSRRSSQP